MQEMPIIPPDNYSGSMFRERRTDPVLEGEQKKPHSEPVKRHCEQMQEPIFAPDKGQEPPKQAESEIEREEQAEEELAREALPTLAHSSVPKGLFSRFPLLSGLLPPHRTGAGSSISEIALIVLLLLALSGEGEGGHDLLGNDTLPFLLLLLFWS